MKLILLFTNIIFTKSYLLTPFQFSKFDLAIDRTTKKYNFDDFGSTITLMNHAEVIDNKIDTSNNSIDFGHYDLVISSESKYCKDTLNLLRFYNKPQIIIDECFNEVKHMEDQKYIEDFFSKSDKQNSESIFEAGLRSYFATMMYTDDLLFDNSKILILSHRNTLRGLWAFLNLEYFLSDGIEYEDDYNVEKQIRNVLNHLTLPEFENLFPYYLNR